MQKINPNLHPKQVAKIPAMKGNTADPKLPAEKVNPKTVPSFSVIFGL